MEDFEIPESLQITDLLETARARWPEKPAISCEGKTWSWAQTVGRIRSIAALLKSLGIEHGDRVAYLGLNSHRIYECYWAPAYLGSMLVPVNYRLAVREMIECLEDSTPKVLFVDDHYLKEAKEIQTACPSITHLIYAGDKYSADATPEGMLHYDYCAATFKEGEVAPGSADDTVMIFYTGGTTGRSKGVMLTHTNFFTNTYGGISMYRLNVGKSFMISGPLFHLAAGARVFISAAIGGHSILLPKFDVKKVLQDTERYKINSMTLVPTMMQMILDHPQFEDYDLSSLDMVAYGAAPMPPALIKRVLKVFPQAEIFQTFGMTEAAPILTTLDSKYHVTEGPHAGKLNSVGRAVPYVEVKVVDENDRELGVGETGEIVARGDNIMKGYWQMPELSAEALKGGWYHTGDAGYLDEDGFLYLEGRIKDMIISGGENIYPIEVESVLGIHPSVHQCAVIGIPHETWGEAVHGVVTLNAGSSTNEQDLLSFCRDRLAHYKCPVSVTIREEAMPLSAVNKILKTELRKPFWPAK